MEWITYVTQPMACLLVHILFNTDLINRKKIENSKINKNKTAKERRTFFTTIVIARLPVFVSHVI